MSRTGAPIRLLKIVPTLLCGGTENQAITLARSLHEQGYAVEVACLRRLGPFVKEISDRGIPLSEYHISGFYSVSALVQKARFLRHIVKCRIDVMHSYSFYGNVFGILPARLAATPVVIASIRDRGAYLTPMQKRVQRFVCRFADCVLVNATAVKAWLVSEGYDPSTIIVIPNGVELNRFDALPEPGRIRFELGVPDGAPLVMVVSRLTRQKGLEQFLEAAGLLAARFPTARFAVVGYAHPAEQDYENTLKAMAGRLGLTDRVIFTGLRQDVPALLAAATISVMPSLNEALSNVLLESMAAGAAVVATRVGGTPEAIMDGVTGLLVEPGDASALAESIARLVRDPALARRLGRAARRHIEDRYSVERMVFATEQLYLNLLARKRRKMSPAASPRVPALPRHADRWRWHLKVKLASAIAGTWRLEQEARRSREQRRPLILGYHRVVEDFAEASQTEMPSMLISRAMFERHIEWVGRRFRFASLDEIGERMSSGRPFSGPVAAITFDDGYRDVYENAFPFLRRKGIPAAMFLVTDLVSRPLCQTHDRLYYLVERAFTTWNDPRRELVELMNKLTIPSAQILRHREALSSAMTAVSTLLPVLPQADVIRLMNCLETLVGPASAEAATLTWPMVHEMRRGGMTIGSHTRTHVSLPMETDDSVRDELEGSKRFLEAQLGERIDHFAYPGGQFTPQVVRASRDAGYRYAYTACRHGDMRHPELTLERLFLWEGSSSDADGHFSSAVFNCQIHDLWPPARRCERTHHV
ncbi:MAG: glycosyltransferase [Acidobacteria bacterium]|nr:MAG: glycosyltransferase [Acidobacteriota bacterium]